MPFNESVTAELEGSQGDNPDLDSLWGSFARDVEAICESSEGDGGGSAQRALRQITHVAYNQLVYDDKFLSAFREYPDPQECGLTPHSEILYQSDQISVELVSIYRSCQIPLQDLPGSYGVTLVLSGIAKVTYASVIERDDENSMARLKIDRVRERLPGQVCWCFSGETDLHGFEAMTSSVQLLVIHIPALEGGARSYYRLGNHNGTPEGSTVIAQRIAQAA